MYRAVDVMGFAGGFTLGMVQSGFTLVGKRELKGGFGVANCEANRHLLGDGWQAEACHEDEWSVVPADVVFGNPPCSGFSVMSAKHFRGANSPINHCMWAFAGFVIRTMPQIAIFESVQMARTRQDGLELMRALRAHVEEKTGERWDLYHVRHNALSLGGVAMRRRYFWVISRIPFGVEVPKLDRLPVLNDALSDLEPLGMAWEAQPYRSPATWWSHSRRSTQGTVDGHINVTNPLTGRIRSLMDGVEWNEGEHISQVARRYYERYGCLPGSFCATEEKIVKNDFNFGFTTPTRWNGKQVARVITGGSLFTGIHPNLERTLTHREAARIMGFPDDWNIEPLRHVSGLAMTHGKGITVDCGRWVGEWIKLALDENPGTHKGEEIGEREFDIDVTHSWKSALGIEPKPSKVKSVVVRKTTTNIEGVTMTEPTEGAVTRGRPRPAETIERDEKVLAFLEASRDENGQPVAKTREEIAAGVGIEGKQAYLSIFRLKRDDKIVKADGGHRWAAKSGQ